MIEATA